MPVRRFSPGFLILTLLFVALTLSLGFWQLDRADQKQALLDIYGERSEISVPLGKVIDDWQSHHYQRIGTEGAFLPDKQIFLENQVREGQVGYHAYVPFRTVEDDVILVNTGWQKELKEKEDIPDTQVQIEALLRPPPEVGIRLGSLDQTSFDRPYRTPYLDIDWIGRRLNLDLSPFVLLLATDRDGEIATDWIPVRMPPERHRGYAVTWFSLAAALVALFVVYSFKKE
ncbi:MAG: SURF1 family protein [Sedimenticolaceae bacterium]|nr:SURF1 family protein [Sedimenticolaceae bacterium]